MYEKISASFTSKENVRNEFTTFKRFSILLEKSDKDDL